MHTVVGSSNWFFRNHLMYFHLYNGATYFHNCRPSGAKKGNFPPAVGKRLDLPPSNRNTNPGNKSKCQVYQSREDQLTLQLGRQSQSSHWGGQKLSSSALDPTRETENSQHFNSLFARLDRSTYFWLIIFKKPHLNFVLQPHMRQNLSWHKSAIVSSKNMAKYAQPTKTKKYSGMITNCA